MTKLRLLHGPEIQRTLGENDVDVFPYALNKPGLYLFGILATVLYALAGLCWWETQLAQPIWTAVFAGLLLSGTGLALFVGYWHNYATSRVLAVSPDRLYVGGKDRLWAIEWNLLDRESMGFDDMELSRLRGALNVQVGGQTIKVHLFNILAYVQDMEGFMFRLLNHLKEQEDG